MQLSVENKTNRFVAVPENIQLCLVFVLDQYFYEVAGDQYL